MRCRPANFFHSAKATSAPIPHVATLSNATLRPAAKPTPFRPHQSSVGSTIAPLKTNMNLALPQNASNPPSPHQSSLKPVPRPIINDFEMSVDSDITLRMNNSHKRKFEDVDVIDLS